MSEQEPEEIECGGCVRPLPGLGRVFKEVVPTDLQRNVLAWETVNPYLQTQGLLQAVHAAMAEVVKRPVGARVGYKQLPNLAFVVRNREEPVMQPPRFAGTPEAALASGWAQTEFGWACPACVSTAHTTDEGTATIDGADLLTTVAVLAAMPKEHRGAAAAGSRSVLEDLTLAELQRAKQ